MSATRKAAGGAGAGPVALLSLHARRDRSFLDDFDLYRISGGLRAAGVESDVVVALVPPDAERDAAELEALARALRPYRTVVYERLWSARLARWLREALPAATIVHISGGHALAGAPADHVAAGAEDALALLGRLAGRPTQPLSAGTRPNLRPVYATPDARPVDPSLPVFGSEGCPYRADPRANPAYASVPLPEAIGGGCAFCTTGGAFVARPADEVLEHVLRQVRAIRADAPEVTRIVLRDQRPFAYLPDLVARCAAEGLGPFTLLLQSRADWFLREGARFASALQAAERTGLRLAPFLVGVESFSQAELDRFNKGVRVETLVAFLRALRSWKVAHPAALDLSQGAYGFILFTPWTTLDDLAENLRWIRATRFGELRRHFLLSRLRLYPEAALYHLAARDGLLAAGTGDDPGARYGYLPSRPWRFRDRRVARIAALAPGLLEGGAGRDEPALLEALLAVVGAAPDPDRVTQDDASRRLEAILAARREAEADVARALVGAPRLPVELPGTRGLRLLAVEPWDAAFLLRLGRESPIAAIALRDTPSGLEAAVEQAPPGADAAAVARASQRLARLSPRRWTAARDAALEHVGPSRAAGTDVEAIALAAGLKPAVRITAPDVEAEAVAARLEALGASVLRADGYIRTEGRARAVLYASLDRRRAEELRDAEAPTLSADAVGNPAARMRRVGALLGYPSCCVEAFVARREAAAVLGETAPSEGYLNAASAWVARPDALLNTLLRASRVQLLSHEPCRFDCERSAAYAAACLAEIARRDREGARELVRALARAVVIAPGGGRALARVDPGPPPRIGAARPPWASVDPADAALARAIVGREVGARGALPGDGAPAPLLVDFAMR